MNDEIRDVGRQAALAALREMLGDTAAEAAMGHPLVRAAIDRQTDAAADLTRTGLAFTGAIEQTQDLSDAAVAYRDAQLALTAALTIAVLGVSADQAVATGLFGLEAWTNEQFADVKRRIGVVLDTYNDMVRRVKRSLDEGVVDESVLRWCREVIEIPPELPLPPGQHLLHAVKLHLKHHQFDRVVALTDATMRAKLENHLMFRGVCDLN